ncbi:MAG: serine/threonine protein kinase [Candidatus Eisenbacteria bacterium]|uniref:Serine/threonine protein kinase n=1 Tax=Eiseniibacteriota bacterium TaxID=2212470 RepID=A0A948RRP2_UNCEI|nr:serine/threonine protein kinase [Candidatus Eisenbacteria bacterium]MBU1950871.1 serine/threonine protein kinase [Candidatus Eisenbacteria bacterium]MBU2689750.1 serine/threonine protein kinase [Candidatus Eisenbacteria bacterium]
MSNFPKRPIKIGNYVIIGELGRGGMGIVYLAQDLSLGRQIAIKVLPPELASEQETLERFRREAKLLASLSHPNIATVYSFDESDDLHYITLEVIKGCTLAERLAAGPLDLGSTLHLCRQILAALETAHGKGIIHRDLKPSNVMLTEDDDAKVLDFGLAKVSPGLPGAEDGHTAVGTTLGTAGYASPEQLRGDPIDHRTDLWSFGCILYECLTGDRLFRGNTQADQIAATLANRPDWDGIPADCPHWLLKILESCLTMDVDDRPSSAREIRQLLSNEQVSSLKSRIGRTSKPIKGVEKPTTSLWRLIRHPAITIGVTILALALCTIGARELALSKIRLNVEGKTISATAPILGKIWSHTHESNIRFYKTLSWSSGRSVAFGLSNGWPDGGKLFLCDFKSGHILWEYSPNYRELTHVFGEELANEGAYNCRSLHFGDLDGDGIDELIAEYGHHRRGRAFVVILKADGERMGCYYNPGLLYDIVCSDLDGDDKEELIIAGTNNLPHYEGGTVILLDQKHCYGAAIDSSFMPDCSLRDNSQARIVFPAHDSEFMQRLGIERIVAFDLETSRNVAGEAVITCSVGHEGAPHVITLDHQLNPLDCWVSDPLHVAAKSWSPDETESFLGEIYLESWMARWQLFGYAHSGDVGR